MIQSLFENLETWKPLFWIITVLFYYTFKFDSSATFSSFAWGFLVISQLCEKITMFTGTNWETSSRSRSIKWRKSWEVEQSKAGWKRARRTRGTYGWSCTFPRRSKWDEHSQKSLSPSATVSSIQYIFKDLCWINSLWPLNVVSDSAKK